MASVKIYWFLPDLIRSHLFSKLGKNWHEMGVNMKSLRVFKSLAGAELMDFNPLPANETKVMFPPPEHALENNHMKTLKYSFIYDLGSGITVLLCFCLKCIILS